MGTKSREKKERKQAQSAPRQSFLERNMKYAGAAAGAGAYALTPIPRFVRDSVDAVAFFVKNTKNLASSAMRTIYDKTKGEVAKTLGQEEMQQLFNKPFQDAVKKHVEYLNSWDSRLKDLENTYYSLARDAAKNPISKSPVIKPLDNVYTEILKLIATPLGRREDVETRATEQYHVNMSEITSFLEDARRKKRQLTEKELKILRQLSRKQLEELADSESKMIEQIREGNASQIKNLERFITDYNKLERLTEQANNLTTQEIYHGRANENYQAVVGIAQDYGLSATVERPGIGNVAYGDAAMVMGGVIPVFLGYKAGKLGGKVYRVGRKGVSLAGKVGKLGLKTGYKVVKLAVKGLGDLGDNARGIDRKNQDKQ